MIANAILDRLIHHSTIFNITGKSYRIKDKFPSKNDDELQYKNVGFFCIIKLEKILLLTLTQY